MDSQYCADPSKFIAAILTSVTLMLQLEMPAISVLSKIDLVEEYGPLRTYWLELLFSSAAQNFHRFILTPDSFCALQLKTWSFIQTWATCTFLLIF